MVTLTRSEVESAKHYKYSGQDDSILAKLFLRKWWDFCLRFIPQRMSPNIVTLIGFIFEIASSILSIVYSKCLTAKIPVWLKIVNGITLFFYQTMDNLDGRQARRTSSSSPIGQFFDHGCDALTGVFELVKCCASFELNVGRRAFIFIFMFGFGFFANSWEEYCTGSFYLGVINGPDEGLLLLSIAHLLSAVFPWGLYKCSHSIWIDTGYIICFAGTVLLTMHGIYKKGAISTALKTLLPVLVTIAIFLTIGIKTPYMFENFWFVISACFVLQYQGQLLIFSHLVNRSWLYMIDLRILIQWFLAIFLYIICVDFEINYWIPYFVVQMVLLVSFDIGVVRALSKGLDLPVFRLKSEQ